MSPRPHGPRGAPSPGPGELRALLELDPRELPAFVQAHAAGEAGAAWVEALRGEAARFYHTDAATARRIAARALAVAQLNAHPLALGWGHRTMAEALLFSGRMRDAETAYARASHFFSRAGAGALLGQLLVGRTHVLALLGRLEEVRRTAREARRLLTAAKDQVYLGKLAMNLGNLHFQRDAYSEAMEEYARASRIFTRLGLRDETVLGCEINRAVALTHLDREEEALRLFAALEDECARDGFDLLRAQVWMNSGYVTAQQAEYRPALRDLGQAAEYFRATEHPTFLASCLVGRAEIYQALNLHEDSLELAREAAPLFSREGMRYDLAVCLVQQAHALMALRRLPEATAALRRARRLFVREGNLPRIALLSLLAAEVDARRRRYGEAEAGAREARRIFRRLGLLRWESMSTVLLARLLPQRGRPPARASTLIQAQLKRLGRRHYPLASYRLLEALGESQERSGRPLTAIRTYARAVSTLEDLRARVPTEESKISFLGDKCHLYDRLIRLELGKTRPSAARLFAWMERSRAQALWDRLRGPSAFSPRDEDARLRSRRRRLSWLYSRVARLELGSEEDRARADRLRREMERAEALFRRALRDSGERAGEAFGDALPADPSAVPSPAEIARALPAGWGYLSFHLAADFSLALFITSRGTHWRALAPDLSRRVSLLAERLDFQWSAAAVSTVSGGRVPGSLLSTTETILEELYRLLWKPLEEAGLDPGLRWIVSPHGPVHRIPLHALRDRRGYWIERSDLALTPSARIWREIRAPRGLGADRKGAGRARTSAKGGRAYVAGVPSAALPGIRREVDKVRLRLGGLRVTLDLAPTRAALRKASAASDLIHLAAHGSLRRDNPSFSFVELADGPLYVYDLADLALPGTAVVLTACSSGQGEASAGDEWIGLARGFLRAGASSVTASLWPIEDESTLELMDLFYGAWSLGDCVAGSLGSAMRSLRERRPHPWNWASFAVLGGGAPVPERPAAGNGGMLSGGAA